MNALLKYVRLCNIVEAYTAAAWQHDIDFVTVMFDIITFKRNNPSLDSESTSDDIVRSDNSNQFLETGRDEKIYLIIGKGEVIPVKIIPGLLHSADEEIPQEKLNSITKTFKDLLRKDGISVAEVACVE